MVQSEVELGGHEQHGRGAGFVSDRASGEILQAIGWQQSAPSLTFPNQHYRSARRCSPHDLSHSAPERFDKVTSELFFCTRKYFSIELFQFGEQLQPTASCYCSLQCVQAAAGQDF